MGGGSGGGGGDILGAAAGANPFAAGAAALAPALAGGPSSTGDVAADVTFGPVNVGGLFGSGTSSRRDPSDFIPLAVIGGIAIIAIAFIARRR